MDRNLLFETADRIRKEDGDDGFLEWFESLDPETRAVLVSDLRYRTQVAGAMFEAFGRALQVAVDSMAADLRKTFEVFSELLYKYYAGGSEDDPGDSL